MKKYKQELMMLIQTHKHNWQNIIKSTYRYIYDDMILHIPIEFKNQSISTYVVCYLNDITSWPTCIICGKKIEQLKTDVQKGFSKTCNCKECKNAYKYLATKNAIQEKYGVDNVFSLDSVIQKSRNTKKDKYGFETYNNSEKAKNTCLYKYGVSNPAKSENIKEKTKNTCLDKYGVEYSFQAESVKKKIQNTSLDRYGVINPGTSKLALQKIEKTMQEKYGVSSPGELLNNPIYANKSKQTCQNKYGVDYPAQAEKAKQSAKQTCLKKYGCSNHAIYVSYQIMVQDEYSQPCFSLNDLDTHDKNIPLKFKCLKCGKTYEAFHSDGMHKRCPICYPKPIQSYEELELYEFIKSLTQTNNAQICHNDRSIISPYELDIYVPSKKIAFEFDGLYWHQFDENHLTDKRKHDANYHLNKTNMCEKNDIQLIHIFENEWISHSKIVKSRIKNLFGIFDDIVFARKCIVKKVDDKIAVDFLSENHLQGSIHSKINLGLYFNGNLISLMTFGKPRFNKKYEWELLRFCNKLGYHIPGAAGKLLKHFEANWHPTSLISYADRRWSQGKLYNALGFTFDHASAPNYWYWKNTSMILSRLQCQKHKLKTFLPKFDENLTEKENMKINGYFMIYDCGNLVYVKEYV